MPQYDIRARAKDILCGAIDAAIQREQFHRITISRLVGSKRQETDTQSFLAEDLEGYDTARSWLDETIAAPPYCNGGRYKIRAYHGEGKERKATMDRTFQMTPVSVAETSRASGTGQAVEGLAGNLTTITQGAVKQTSDMVSELGQSYRDTRDYVLELERQHNDEKDDLKAHIMELTQENTELKINAAVRDAMDDRPSLLDPETLPVLLQVVTALGEAFKGALAPAPSPPSA